MSRTKIRMLIEIALMAALSLILDLLIPSISHGIKINIKMLPIVILALRWGTLPGMVGGLLWGLLQIATGDAYILGFAQGLIEYVLAFAAIGLAGLMHKQIQNTLMQDATNKGALATFSLFGLVIGSFFRYLFHFIAGVIFWSENMDSTTAAIANSITVNGLAFITETVTCAVVLLLLIPAYAQIIKNPVSMEK